MGRRGGLPLLPEGDRASRLKPIEKNQLLVTLLTIPRMNIYSWKIASMEKC